jgi:hypothetical protein
VQRRLRPLRRLAWQTVPAISRRLPRSRRLIGMPWLALWGLRFHRNRSSLRLAKILSRSSLAFPHRLSEPESRRKKNVANAARSEQYIRTRKTNEPHGRMTSVAANLNSDMSGQHASEATKQVLSRHAIDTNLVVLEAIQGTATGGHDGEDAEVAAAVAATTVPLDTPTRVGRIARKPAESCRRRQSSATSAKNSRPWRTAQTVRTKLRGRALDMRMDRAAGGAADEGANAVAPIELKAPRANRGRRQCRPRRQLMMSWRSNSRRWENSTSYRPTSR